MSFRTVVISKQAKLNYKNRFLVVKQGIDEKYIHLTEIDTLIIDSISVSISTYLLKELSDYKINIIFCDEKHNPFGELKSFYNKHNTSKKIINQTKWPTKIKDNLWALIIKNKLINQSQLLKKIKSDNMELILSYIPEIKIGDKTNREGHAAKVYFNSLFGKKFSRNNENSINSALNYGYAVLLSTINKEVIVYFNKEKEFNTDYKLSIINIFNNYYTYKNKKYTLKDILKMYVKNTLECLDNNKTYQEFIYEG